MPSSDLAAAVTAANQCLQQSQVDQAFACLEPFASQATEDRDCALALLNLWRHAPGRKGLKLEVARIADAFPEQVELITAACDALIREAERIAPDQPPPSDGAAHRVVSLAQRCLERAVASGIATPQAQAYLQMCLGNGLRLLHLYDRAVAAMTSALDKFPEQGAWWFNLGLTHKQRGDFASGLRASMRARQLLGDQKAVLWNIAICATGCGEGRDAVDAFAALGLAVYVTDTGMPQIDHMPPVQVRVATVSPGHMGPSAVPHGIVSFELVWVIPLSPCHGVVQTATYRQGSVDYGDVILWDAVPVGAASWEGKPTPRFPLLAVLSRGKERRFRFIALQRESGALDALEGQLPLGAQLFVHRERMELPEGFQRPVVPAADERLVYGKVVIPDDVDLMEFKLAFEARVARAKVELVMPELLEALGDTAGAGKAHTLWRGLERTIEKSKAH